MKPKDALDTRKPLDIVSLWERAKRLSRVYDEWIEQKRGNVTQYDITADCMLKCAIELQERTAHHKRIMAEAMADVEFLKQEIRRMQINAVARDNAVGKA